MGPGLAFQQAFGDEAEIVGTIVCGDSYFGENTDKVKPEILKKVAELKPDLFIAGPAFNAGRYGFACATIAAAVQEELHIPVITGMYIENPGADEAKSKILYRFYQEQRCRYERCCEEDGTSWLEACKRREDRFLQGRRIYPTGNPCKLLRG